MAFSGWPVEALEFFEGLQADNSRTYWTAHKPLYERSVYGPMAELLEELAGEFGPGRIARPYRDVRFSPDKSPYKTSIYAILEDGGYVNLSAAGLTAGMGYFHMAADQLERYRHAVADDAAGAELAGIVDRIAAEGVEVGGSSSLKSAPRGYPKDHPRIDLLRHRDLIAWRRWPPAAWLHTAAAKRRVVDFLRTTSALRAWLDERVGPSTAPRARR
jgi:uncharacterized protein (TIGR02453 family)